MNKQPHRYAQVRRWVCAFGLALLPAWGTACAQDRITATVVSPAEAGEARNVLKFQLERTPLVRNVVFHMNAGEVRYIEYTEPGQSVNRVVQLVTLLPDAISVTYSPGNFITLPAWNVAYTEFVGMHRYNWLSSTWSQADANAVARSLRLLVLDARQDALRMQAAGLEKFRQTCQGWRDSQNKPALPAEAQRHVDLAEQAAQGKDLDKAADEYIDAMKIYPCSPAAQARLASLLADTGWYESAANNMQRYLELAPDAPDAQAAREKMRIWMEKSGH